MDNEKRFKLTGENIRIDYSPDGSYIIIGGYDGGVKIFAVSEEKICCKTKLKGPKNEIYVGSIGMSCDNKYAAFSALKKVFVMDIAKKEIIGEFAFSPQERTYSSDFCFFNHSNRLVIPDGERLLVHDIETVGNRYIPLPEGAGWTDCLAISPDDAYIAYKSGNGVWDLRMDREGNMTSDCNTPSEDLSDKVYIYDAATGACKQILPVPYPPVRAIQVNLSGCMRFVEERTLVIARKTIGFTYFDVETGAELGFINWKQRGYEFADFHYGGAKLYAKGRFVLFNHATPDPKTIERDEHGIAKHYEITPEEWECILFDTKEDKVIYQLKGQHRAAFHPEKRQLAYLDTVYDENLKRTEYLCICELI